MWPALTTLHVAAPNQDITPTLPLYVKEESFAGTSPLHAQVVDSVVGTERLKRFVVILAGDDVTKKKPDPLIYNMARERLGISADK